ncbi:MAG TPA: L-aspartate oxidase [Actinomycetes bacterium]
MPAAEVDVLVVGSGVAGLSTALALPGSGSVLLATKGTLGEGATRYAQGGIAAVTPAGLAGPLDDSAGSHLDDTLAAGAGLCDPAAVRVLVEEADAAVAHLRRLGVRFDQAGAGLLARTLEGGHSRPRILHAGGDATGAEIERALVAASRDAGVRVAEHAFLVDLLTGADGAVGGAVLAVGSELSLVRAKAVVLASGGAGQLWTDTTNPALSTGDGQAAALRAGAVLADLEFVQFHPTALHVPVDPRPLISEAMRGEGAVLRDLDGEPVMAGQHPRGDLAPRDVVTRAMAARMAATGAEHLWLDATAVPAERLERRFPTILARCRAAGIEPTSDPIPVSPAAHYLMGGILTDLDGRTSLPGLYAVGEAACTGVHGANRLASNSLLEGIVFAARIGRAVAGAAGWPAAPALGGGSPGARPGQGAGPAPAAVTGDGAAPGGATGSGAVGDPAATRAALRREMTDRAGVLRSAEGLAAAAAAIAALPTSLPARPEGWETANLVQLATALVELAARREESRGAHWREDFPDPLEAWRVRQTIARAPDGGLVTGVVPVPSLAEVVR